MWTLLAAETPTTPTPATEAANWLNWEQIGTFAGATLAVVVVSNVVHMLIKKTTLTVPLAVSFVLSLAAAAPSFATGNSLQKAILMVVNWAMLFSAATGANESAGRGTPPPPAGGGAAKHVVAGTSPARGRVFNSWLP
jgi:hypothetical protein